MRIDADRWLSDVLERPVFAVNLDPDDDRAAAARGVTKHASEQRAGLYFARLPSTDVGGAAHFASAGFRIVETRLGFSRPLGEPVGGDDEDTAPGISIAEFQNSWREGVLDIAGSCFRYSRFHMDPDVGRTPADRVKREWIRSYVEGRRGDRLLVACERGGAVGFAAMLVNHRGPRPAAVIDLIGVRPDAQGRGIGRALIRTAASTYASSCASIEVGTQACNVPSVRLYERMAFRLAQSAFMLHLHADAR
jgi:GNAT superfamily N-acetyltransferase